MVISVLVLGLIGSTQDVYAGIAPPSSGEIVWTGEGGDNSFFNSQNWRDAIFENHRPPSGLDVIYIDDRCSDPFLPQYQVDNAEVHLDFFATFLLFGTIVICSDDTLVIDGGHTLEINSLFSLDNSGTLIIDGTLLNTASGVVNNDGVIINNNLFTNAGTINNNAGATINNNDEFDNNDTGSILNNDGGTITNDGTIDNNDDGFIRNRGTINNNAQIENNEDGIINNNPTGIINNEDTIDNNDDGNIRNGGIINNEDTINNNDDSNINNNSDGVINNGGNINNNDDASILNNNGGTINNNNSIENNDDGFIRNRSVINNNDQIDNTDNGIINNNPEGTINNNDGGNILNENEFNNSGAINNKEGAVIDNLLATINNNQNPIADEPDGLIINEGTINNPSDDTINNFALIINQCPGQIIGESPDDQDDGITHNRSCNGILYSIDKSNPPNLREIDPTNANTFSEVDISLAGFDPDEIKGGTGLATNPLTGELFALLKLDPDDDEGDPSARTLVTIIPETGVATMLGVAGNTGDAFAGIAFDSDGNLFGVTGDGADVDQTLFSLSTTDGSATELCEFGNGGDGESLAFNSDDGTLYHASGNILETVDDISSEVCTVTDVPLNPDDPGEVTALTYDEAKELFIWANFDELNTITANPGDVTFIDDMDHDSKGLAFVPFPEEAIAVPTISPGASGSTTSQDPNLGDVRHGTGHPNGFCHLNNCMDVDGYFNHFPETTVPQGSTQTFTLLVNCPRGANTCNHVEIAGALPDSDFYDYQWAATVDRQPGSDNWILTTNNPFGEIGEVTVTVQKIDHSFISVTFNIPFLIPGSIGTHDGIGDPQENNRHLHVTVWDSNGGMSNYIFNEGVYVDDIYAYPQVETSYDAPLEYESLCLNEDSTKRYTCAFDKVKQWTIKNAEEKLKEMYEGHGNEMDSYDESEQY